MSVKPTYEGVVLLPISLAMISTRSFCQTPTQLQATQRSASAAQVYGVDAQFRSRSCLCCLCGHCSDESAKLSTEGYMAALLATS